MKIMSKYSLNYKIWTESKDGKLCVEETIIKYARIFPWTCIKRIHFVLIVFNKNKWVNIKTIVYNKL